MSHRTPWKSPLEQREEEYWLGTGSDNSDNEEFLDNEEIPQKLHDDSDFFDWKNSATSGTSIGTKSGHLEDWEKKWDKKFKQLYQNMPGTRKRKIQSEAVLSCPGCFTILTEVCQKQGKQGNLWRSLEVSKNCRVDRGKFVNPEELTCHPVYCRSCSAEVGEFDNEVYIFGGVIPTPVTK